MNLPRLLGATALVVTLLAGCGDDDGDTTASGPASEAPAPDEIPSFTITATDYEFALPEDLTGGVVELTLENRGAELHELLIITAPDGGAEQAVADIKPVMEGGPIPDYWEVVTGVTDIEAGGSQTSKITLPAGDYALLCTIPQGTVSWDDDESEEEGEAEGESGEEDGEEPPMHAELGMVEAFSVTEVNDLELPEEDGRVTIRDYGFDLPALEAGKFTLSTVNEGEEFHHVGLFSWPEEITSEEQAEENFRKLMEAEGGPPPEGTVEPDEAGWSAVFAPGLGGTFEAEFEAGRWYTAICFISDRAGGPPHAIAHEMYHHFQVPE